eukprot:s4755_g3.t1
MREGLPAKLVQSEEEDPSDGEEEEKLEVEEASGVRSGGAKEGSKSVPQDPSDAETVPASDSLIAALPTDP